MGDALKLPLEAAAKDGGVQVAAGCDSNCSKWFRRNRKGDLTIANLCSMVNNTLSLKNDWLWLSHHPFNSPAQGGALGDTIT